MVPHLWHSSLIHGLSVSLLVWHQKGEAPDAIVWQATNESRDALFLADDPQIAYIKAIYHEDNPERLARRIVLASLGELMTVAQRISLTMDRLAVERTQVTEGSPKMPSLTDLLREADAEIEHMTRRRAVETHPTIAWSDLPTVTVHRITGDDMGEGGLPPQGYNSLLPPSPPLPPPPPPSPFMQPHEPQQQEKGWMR